MAHAVRRQREGLLRQDQERIALPARQHEPSVPHGHLGERGARDEVVGEARRDGHGHLVRVVPPVDVEVARRTVPRRVAHERPLLQHPLAALLVEVPPLRKLPPRLRAVVVDAERPHRHARQPRRRRPRLVREAVVDDAVEPFRVDPVALRLHAPRGVLPAPLARVRGEGLRRDDAPPLRVGDGRGLAHPVRAVELRPELGRRDVRMLAVEEVVGRDLAVGLDREAQPRGVGEAAHLPRVVLREKLRHREAEVAVEALRRGDGIDDAPREGGQPRQDRVAVALLERGLEALRPVLRADLVAVVQHGPERTLRPREFRAERLDGLPHVVRPVEAQRLLRELVAFKPLAHARARAVLAVQGLVADAQDRPRPGGRVPDEPSVLHAGREVDDRRAADDGPFRRDARVGDVVLAPGVREALERPVLQLERLGRRGEGDDGDVAVEAHLVLRLRQRALEPRAARDGRRREADRLHRVLGRVPRSAGVRPAAAVRHAELQAEALRLLRGEAHRLVPFRRIEDERPFRDAPADAEPRVEEDRAADAHAGHRLQVGRDARARHVPGHPVPPHLRLRLGGRVPEPSLQIRPPAKQGACGRRQAARPHSKTTHSLHSPQPRSLSRGETEHAVPPPA